jgi:hypothetical protein
MEGEDFVWAVKDKTLQRPQDTSKISGSVNISITLSRIPHEIECRYIGCRVRPLLLNPVASTRLKKLDFLFASL